MAKGIYIGVNNVARKVKQPYIGVGSVAREVKKGYIGVDNVARTCFENGTEMIFNLYMYDFDEYGSVLYASIPFIYQDGMTFADLSDQINPSQSFGSLYYYSDVIYYEGFALYDYYYYEDEGMGPEYDKHVGEHIPPDTLLSDYEWEGAIEATLSYEQEDA